MNRVKKAVPAKKTAVKKALAKKAATPKKTSKRKKANWRDDFVWPEKLSKAGQWLKDNPDGLGVIIHDMRAVLK